MNLKMFLIYTEEIISLGFCLLYVSGFPLAGQSDDKKDTFM